MKIVVIGATGHVGGYLVPRLVRAGHSVVALSRGLRAPYRADDAWHAVERIDLDREAEDSAGTFGERVASLGADVVIDMICFSRASAAQLVESLRGRVRMLVSCGSIWSRGILTEVPGTEDSPLNAWGEYGVGKAELERYLLEESARPNGLPSVIIDPGHISGPGWHVINPAGNLDPLVWERLAFGERVILPDSGLGMLHHVHADDVAQLFELAVASGPDVGGNAFFAVSASALTLRGFAEAAAGWFGHTANLGYVPLAELASATSEQNAATTIEHVARSHAMSIDKARRMLGYRPAYTSLEATREAVGWLNGNGAFERRLAFV
ncbi:NAD-dependent epimerase/dehydratase family protein [Humibacter sp. RRB41]|uniref:NAD-dependent epimerase/dehydratase family protein n=1 Tax=Humibacter sp. RRB41 TaxID=2919946 RepID=UPI001FAA6764|nr:NAD-dependent epimerase/dehydratase family protein [Humibacter sp. RRB41]